MFEMAPPTRSQKTCEAYEKRYRGLASGLERELDLDKITPNEVAAGLLQKHSSGAYSQRTWRVFKAAALYILQRDHPECEEAIENLKNATSAGLPKSSHRTSGPKAKAVSNQMMEALVRALRARARHRPLSQETLSVIQATVRTGLRPNEWAHSSVARHQETGRLILRVRNSKFSNGRANGEYREIFIDKLPADALENIHASIKAFETLKTDREIEKKIKRFQNEIIEARTEAGEDPLVTRHTRRSLAHVTLYSFRHQFVADTKLSLTGTPDHAVVLAALLGHNSVETAPMHYGRRQHGGTHALQVMPTTESIEAVQRIQARTYANYLARKETPLSPLHPLQKG